jgi:hypothetical protein
MSLEKFDLVGVRYTKYHYDESALLHDSRPSVNTVYKINSADPKISDFFYQGRKVIEVVVSVRQFASPDEGEASNQNDIKELLAVECVAGFVATSESDDGNLDLFNKSEESWGRVIYWLVRQRIRSLTMGTLLDSASLPHDVRAPKAIKKGKKKPASSAKKEPKLKGRA